MTERQKFDLVRKIGKVEIRNYHPCAMADVTINSSYGNAANLGFRPLVTYISQNNIAMTAPVLQEERAPQSWIVSFVMPADMKLADLPLPKNSQVSLRTLPAHAAAVLSFSGITTESKIHEKESELRAIIEREELTPTGPMRIARFDPPWKPGFLRYNEVIIPISPR
jgi:hypothetical protein